ncbi:MAG TPA: peptidoglycan DD-metalloendopeptidase family protein [Sulfurovum sp.]|nr:MAG: peptidase M24 [Sulfurovum sp. 35-42-20]OYY57140.1 MAG: peptidase M24 [Sulfurovum sp. 28-43-6]OYZ26042.1 MAG: peptidase M24 [Sulfurovum sp. 16-42-52]OYZ50432.1 MAG: peptidase M24 [Sulfurovum sp. 24-42-9]OZA46022.1 MAG: peptidase M24 [Sulfurovum sp. 17-42-90]OZA60319.1 MAG: peptidase M24 [Sulfurovum sp. 39-42-12]HQR73363.1 peptidoglycan DD-metalloendopeptidase family protein [Sulfurovum sp.]
MKSFIFLCVMSVGLVYAASTTAKIKKSEQTLSAVETEKKQASTYLGRVARDIKKTEKEIEYIEKKMDELEADHEATQKEYDLLKSELEKSEEELAQTSGALEEKRQAFISLLSEQFSIVYALEQSHEPTRMSMMMQEIYTAYKEHNTKMLETLKSDIGTLKKAKEDKTVLRNKTKVEIQTIDKKREEYAQKKAAKEKLRKKLSKDEETYNAKLEKIVDKQNSLRSTLAQLNILQAQEVEEAKKRAAAEKEAMRLEKIRQREIREAKALARTNAKKAQEALRKAKTKEDKEKAHVAVKEAEKENTKVYQESEKVKQVNSSYKASATYAYQGGKTISPLSGARVIKKFGTYVDPIYKIKIFNESITMQRASNTKVQNILNGKVVFAGKSSMLGKVVVVSHSDRIHTVYAGLSKIAPTIHVGAKIQKGYVVGKVNEKLIFQATKDSKHIDPLKLIQI